MADTSDQDRIDAINKRLLADEAKVAAPRAAMPSAPRAAPVSSATSDGPGGSSNSNGTTSGQGSNSAAADASAAAAATGPGSADGGAGFARGGMVKKGSVTQPQRSKFDKSRYHG